jgi:hypothetical protein
MVSIYAGVEEKIRDMRNTLGPASLQITIGVVYLSNSRVCLYGNIVRGTRHYNSNDVVLALGNAVYSQISSRDPSAISSPTLFIST